MTMELRRRFWVEVSLATATGALALLTAVWRDWIEVVLRIDPDGGSGAVEWLVVVALTAVCGTLVLGARLELRRAKPATAS
jgi:hypothetical protein